MDKTTKLMTRIFSAVENHEEEVLNQIENDMNMALEDGSVEAEQYSMKKLSDTEVEVTDKVNDGEKTKLSINEKDMIDATPIESESAPEVAEGETKTLDECDVNSTVKEFAKKAKNFIARINGKDIVFDFDKNLCYFVDKPKVTVSFKGDSLLREVTDELEAKSKTFADDDKNYFVVQFPKTADDDSYYAKRHWSRCRKNLNESKEDIKTGATISVTGGGRTEKVKIAFGPMTEEDADNKVKELNAKTKTHSNFEGISDKYVKTFTARHRERAKLETMNRNLDKLSPNVREYVEKRLAEINKK